tara:strand:+ start:717 stop:872 length:156 start_codon:yes stop_codon:yes gene_type:complete
VVDDLSKLLKENKRMKSEIIRLKDIIKTLKMQISESKSDLIVAKANERGKP